jgi:hypothetical protein
VTELLGTGELGSFDHWPTISTTVGHLQDLDSRWGLPVVGLIAIAAFYALVQETRPSRAGRSEFLVLDRGPRAAERALRQTPNAAANLAFSTSIRSISAGQDAWTVYFSDRSGPEPIYAGCHVIVRRGRAEVAEDCRTG